MTETTATDELYDVPEIVVYGESFIPLDQGAFVYAFADTKIMRPIIDIIPVSQLKSWQALQVIDRTEIAIAALFTNDTGRFFQIVGFGSYPNLIVNVALAININWKYMFSGDDHYWYSDTDRLSVSLDSEEVYVVGWRRTRMKAMYDEPGVKTPEGFIAFRHRSGEPAPLSLWLENQNFILDIMLYGEGITINLPIERLYLNLYHVENKLFKAELMLQMESIFPSENFAINFSPIEKPEPEESSYLKLEKPDPKEPSYPKIDKLDPGLSMDSEPDSVLKTLFFAKTPVLNGRNVEFPSVFLSEENITSLLKIFMMNWK
jgi:hypothetical protein